MPGYKLLDDADLAVVREDMMRFMESVAESIRYTANLEADIERLSDALRFIQSYAETWDDDTSGYVVGARVYDTALDALKSLSGTEHDPK